MHLWDDKIGTVGPTYTSARSADNQSMTPSLAASVIEPHPAPASAGAPRLRLLPKGGRTRGAEREHRTRADQRDEGGVRLAATRADLPVLMPQIIGGTLRPIGVASKGRAPVRSNSYRLGTVPPWGC